MSSSISAAAAAAALGATAAHGAGVSSFTCISLCARDMSSKISSLRSVDEVKELFKPGTLSSPCWNCIHELDLGQLPSTYSLDMLPLLFGTGAPQAWCTNEPADRKTEGVDISKYESGWMPTKDGKGFTGCEKTSNFPGLGSTSIQSHKDVVKGLKDLPRQTNEEEVWRGNELGFLIMNPKVYDNAGISPRTILLGSTPEQHKVIRPILDELYGKCDADCKETLLKTYQELLDGEDIINPSTVSTVWVFKQLFRMTFGQEHDESSFTVEEFMTAQAQNALLPTLIQLLPKELGDKAIEGLVTLLTKIHSSLLPLVQTRFPDLQGEKCGKSESCFHQMTSAIMDTLLAAGGLSVPSAINAGSWVLHADTTNHNYAEDTFPLNYKLDKQNVVPFFYESMRIMSPVVGVPHWKPAPDSEKDDTKSQYRNGNRFIYNIALANKDPNVWGADGNKFRVKSMDTYHKNFVGFADFAQDDTVANGAMNRHCPGKDLALEMGKVWFENWNQEEWTFCGKPSKFTSISPYIGAFQLCRNGATVPVEVEPKKAKLVKVASEDILGSMDFPDEQGNTKWVDADGNAVTGKVPNDFSGVFWMDGNPLPDYVVSFGHANYEASTEYGGNYECLSPTLGNRENNADMKCKGGMYVRPADHGVWSWGPDEFGKALWSGAALSNLVYRFECDSTGANNEVVTYCQIYPTSSVTTIKDGMEITVPKELVHFDMTRVDDDTWVRNSFFPGQDPARYFFKRIYDGEGEKAKHFEAYRSNGTAKPLSPSETKDLFDNGEDTRATVSRVPETQYIAELL